MEITSNSTTETREIAYEVASNAKVGDVYLLEGNLGTGKTTFTKYFAEALGCSSRVQSPTFVLVRRYRLDSTQKGIDFINHLDLYRLSEKKDLVELGLWELINEKDSVTIIEWPEIAKGALTKECYKIKFEDIEENKRKITISRGKYE